MKTFKAPREVKSNTALYRRGFKIAAVLAALFIFLSSPLFSAETFEVTETEHISEAEILRAAGFSPGMNVFLALNKKAKDELQKSPYIKSADIGISLPGTVKIHITERKVRGYIPYLGSYLYIDEEGRVLDVKSYFTKSLPVVSGVSFSGFRLGEALSADNPAAFEVVLKIAQLMTKYELLDDVVKIDVSDLENIQAYIGKAIVIIGNTDHCDEKIRTMAAAIEKLPEDARGTLDLSDLDKQIIFKYLT